MLTNGKRWLCPQCVTRSAQAGRCLCGGRFMLAAPPNKPAMFIGHLVLLKDAPSPDGLLSEMFDGITRFGWHSSDWQIVCKHRSNLPVWMWQTCLAALPSFSDLKRAREKLRTALLLRALAETRLLLLNAPEPTPIFQARYARMFGAQEAPSFGELVDRLHHLYALCPSQPSKIAVLDPQNTLSDEDRVRLAGICKNLLAFKDGQAALRWLLEPSSPNHLPYRSALDLKSGLIRIVDVGGVTGRLFLSQLHGVMLKGWQARPDADQIELTADGWPRSRILAKPTEEGLQWGRIHHLRNTPPAPGDRLPPLCGHVKSWWYHEWPFVIEMWSEEAPVAVDEEPTSTATLIGVGPSAYRGEKDLSALLEKSWTSELTPIGILTEPGTDPSLIRWVHQNFPGVPSYDTSLNSGVQALRDTIALAKRMATR
jgi:hypothetical protein